MDKAVIKVPASSANLACGFDCMGIALTLYNELRFELSDSFNISGCPQFFATADNLAYRGFSAVYEKLSLPLPKLSIHIDSAIPISRGLGSSAALISAGALAANRISGAGLSTMELLKTVVPIEGHPDNLAPAILGGCIASCLYEDKLYTAQYHINPALHFVVLSPSSPLDTALSRSALPKSLDFKSAVYDLPRLAMLSTAMEKGDEELLAFCLSDRIHEPYRLKLIAHSEDVRKLAESLGCRCFCLSGAGSSLLCVTSAPGFADKLRTEIANVDGGWTVYDLMPDLMGARIIGDLDV